MSSGACTLSCGAVRLRISVAHTAACLSKRVRSSRRFTAVSMPTGAGKSTIVSLVNRLYDTTSGRILVDGLDVRDYAQAERWLESIVREDVTRIDPSLDPRFVYSQVFANAGGEHGILDLLTVTRSGRLAILELKATEHIHLPLQAADYWLRIRRHLEQGDFSRYGYFPGIELQTAAPLVYLVAPALRFHPATDTLVRYLSPELEMMRVGLAESWRRGLRVVMRQ